jgi:hypothetical protein
MGLLAPPVAPCLEIRPRRVGAEVATTLGVIVAWVEVALRVADEMLPLKTGDVIFIPAGPEYPH